MLIAFNKPFDLLCQFTSGTGRRTLADFVTVKGVYPAGRLDYDSEGLLLLTSSGGGPVIRSRQISASTASRLSP